MAVNNSDPVQLISQLPRNIIDDAVDYPYFGGGKLERAYKATRENGEYTGGRPQNFEQAGYALVHVSKEDDPDPFSNCGDMSRSVNHVLDRNALVIKHTVLSPFKFVFQCDNIAGAGVSKSKEYELICKRAQFVSNLIVNGDTDMNKDGVAAPSLSNDTSFSFDNEMVAAMYSHLRHDVDGIALRGRSLTRIPINYYPYFLSSYKISVQNVTFNYQGGCIVEVGVSISFKTELDLSADNIHVDRIASDIQMLIMQSIPQNMIAVHVARIIDEMFLNGQGTERQCVGDRPSVASVYETKVYMNPERFTRVSLIPMKIRDDKEHHDRKNIVAKTRATGNYGVYLSVFNNQLKDTLGDTGGVAFSSRKDRLDIEKVSLAKLRDSRTGAIQDFLDIMEDDLCSEIFLAGGALRTLFDEEDIVQDYDLFFAEKDDIRGYVETLREDHEFEVIYERKDGSMVTVRNPEGIKIQMIHDPDITRPEDIFENFDLTASMLATDGTHLYFNQAAVYSIRTKLAKFADVCPFGPVVAMKRCAKYARKGYDVNEAYVQIIRHIEERSKAGQPFHTKEMTPYIEHSMRNNEEHDPDDHPDYTENDGY